MFNLYTEKKILAFVNINDSPDMLTRKVLSSWCFDGQVSHQVIDRV